MPVPHVEQSWQSAEFYANKILTQYRNVDNKHVEWVKQLKVLHLSLI